MKWKVATIAVGVLALALSGGLIYATFFNRPDLTDPDYVTVLESDYNDLIRSVEGAEELAQDRLDRIGELEQVGGDLENQLGNSREEVARLIAERDKQRQLLIDAGVAIGASRVAGDGIEQANSRAYDSIRAGLDLLERSESGDPATEG